MVIDIKKLPEYDQEKIDTLRNLEGCYAKIYTISAYSATVGITQWTDYKCTGMNSTTIFSITCRVTLAGDRDSVYGVTTHYASVPGFELH
jgi:hypothetical protein